MGTKGLRGVGIRGRVGGHLRRTCITGALLVVPLAITYLVLRLIFDFLDGLVQPVVEQLLGRRLPGLGLLLEVVLLYLVGFLFANVIGRRLVRWGQAILFRVPVVGVVYRASRQLIESFSGGAETGFQRVVMLEYPRAGAWTIAFLTGITSDSQGRQLAVTYIPTAPTPNSGWVAIVPLEDVYDTDLTVQQALQFVLSGGILTPKRITALRRVPPSV